MSGETAPVLDVMMAEEEATEMAATAASASVPPLDNVASESERIMMTNDGKERSILYRSNSDKGRRVGA